MNIYFIRHGESQANVLHVISNRDLPHGLTERGQAQAAALTAKLQTAQIHKIYASSILRATQTAEILARALGVSYETTDALREFDCGIVEGKSDQASWNQWRVLVHDWIELGKWDRTIEQGESFNAMRARFVPFVEHVTQVHRNDQAIVLLAHGGVFFCMLPLVLAGIDYRFATAHPITQTGIIRAEATADGLFCREWCGELVGA